METKIMMVTGFTIALMASTASADFNRGFTTGAAAGGGNDGFNATAFDADRSMTRSTGENSLVSRADTDPNYGAAVAEMEMSTGGHGRDNDELYSQSLIDGDQAVGAQVGRKGVLVENTVDGEINQGIAGDGNRVRLVASQLLESEQNSIVVDTPYGGAGGGEAQIVGYSHAAGTVKGPDSSSLQMSSDMTVEAGVEVSKQNLLD